MSVGASSAVEHAAMAARAHVAIGRMGAVYEAGMQARERPRSENGEGTCPRWATPSNAAQPLFLGGNMTEGKRPGGLTALAVINIIWSAFSVLGGFGMMALRPMMEMVAKGDDKEAKEGAEQTLAAIEAAGAMWQVLIAVVFVSAILL